MDKKEYMFSQVEAWKQSGLTQRSYCDQVGIKVPTFNYWVQKSGYFGLMVPPFSVQMMPLLKTLQLLDKIT